MKLFTRLAKLIARSKERQAESNQDTTKSKKKPKLSSTSKKRRKQQPQIGLKPCLKQPNATPKKRKWNIKFLERVTVAVYEVEEIVPKQKQSTTSIQSSEKNSKTAVTTNSPVAPVYKTRFNTFYERLAR